MIVKNEEVMLPACLESVKDADEIVIVDTGSTDKTVEIAKKYGTVHHFEWCDDFAKARNYSISKCAGDWILVIDADEVLKSSIAQVKREIRKAKDKKFMTVSVSMRETVDGVMGEKVLDQKSVRMFRRIPEIKYERAIHNTLTYDGEQVAPRRMALESEIKMDSGFSPSHFGDPDRTIRILTKELEEDPSSTRAMYYLATEYLYKKGDQDTALGLLAKYFQIAYVEGWAKKEPYQLLTNELADACYLMATIYVNKRDWHRAMSCAVTAAACWYSFKAPYVMISKLYEIAGMVEPAKYWRALSEKVNNEGVLFVR